MDVDQRAADFGEELRGEDLHVPGQHHQIDVAAQQVELAPLGFGADVLGRRHMQERHRERAHLVGEVGMVGDHHHHRHVELAATVAPQQIEQAVVFLGRHDRDPFGFGGLGQPEVHVELRGDLLAKITFERVARGRQPGQVKDRALHERAAGLLGGMLVQRHDVGAGAGQEGADRRDQSRAVGAAQQQPADILDRQAPATCARVLLLHLLQGVIPRTNPAAKSGNIAPPLRR